MTSRIAGALALLLLLSGPQLLTGQDWPAFRGADGTASANPGGILARASNIDLKLRWKKDLGSGYSSVVVVDDHVITCYSDGQKDNVISLDRDNGETQWVYSMADSFKGQNGSFDGPITTPLIHDGLVYAMDPSGQLVCLNLQDGSEVWTRHLVDDFGSKQPLYGFATSPVLAAGHLVLQTGVEENSLAGLDPKTGEMKWQCSSDIINSQTPAVVEFHGQPLVLAAGGKKLTGVNPADGSILFEYEHQGGNGSAVTPVPIRDDSFVLTVDDMFSTAVTLRPGNEDALEASEKWRNRSIKNTYNVPAFSGGNLFAYSTRILTCVDPDTGDAIWKSREPGDGFLITIDDHMIINTKQGSLHVAKATSDEYHEVAWLELFDDVCWSLPAYSDDAIFCRNLKEIACVDIVAVEMAGGVASSGDLPTGRQFQAFLDDLQTASAGAARSTMIDAWLEGQGNLPVIEDGIVHFVYRGPGKDVAVASDLFGARQEKKMVRIADTDLFYYAMKLEPDQRANYMFLVDFKPQLDPRNSRSITSSMYAGEMEFAVRLPGEKPLEMSWFGMQDWREPDYLKSLPEELAGTFSNEKLESKIAESSLAYDIYLPPGYAEETEQRFRTIYVFAFPGGRQMGQIEQAVDNIFASANSDVEPAILVFPNFLMAPTAGKVIVEELIPEIDARYRTRADRDSRTTVGFGFAGGNALLTATSNPDLFYGAAVYSPLILNLDQTLADSGLADLQQPMKFYVDWGRYDMFNPHENWDIRDISQQLLDLLNETGNASATGGMANDSADWSSWRNRYVEFLQLGTR